MKKGITIVFVANLVSMFLNIILGFLLPKYLSIESYGYYKMFQLYVSYIGITHLGFCDGIYLKYGGKKLSSIDQTTVAVEASTIEIFQLILAVVGIIVSAVFHNAFILLISFSFLPVNMISFYKNLYQATGEFKNYGFIVSALPCLNCIVDIVMIFIFKVDNFVFYSLTIIFSNLIVFLYFQIKYKKKYRIKKHTLFDIKLWKQNIISGYTLTLGNFASVLLTSIDRWFIQLFLEISQFSYYSFAVSVENIYNTCVSAITTTMYNYLCRVKDKDETITTKYYCIILSLYLVSIAFPLKIIIQIFIPKYLNSIPSIFILFSAHIFYFIIKAIYVNLYKAQNRQSHYFRQMIVVLLISILTNLLAYFLVSKTIEAFAVATLLTAIIWYLICSREFKYLNVGIKDFSVLFVCCTIFLLCGLYISNPILGFILYVFIASVILLLSEHIYMLKLIDIFIDLVKRLVKNLIDYS